MKLKNLFRFKSAFRSKGTSPPPLGTPVPQIWPAAWQKLQSLGPSPSILVVKLDHIGDFISVLPALQRLKACFPTSPLALLCAPFLRDLAASTGLFETIHVYDFFGERRPVAGYAGATHVEELKALGLPAYDLVIDFRYDDDARVLLWGVDAQMRVAYAGPQRLPLDFAVPEIYPLTRPQSAAAALDAKTRMIVLVEALATAGERGVYQGPLGRAGLPLDPAYVVLAPGARLQIKRWHHAGWLGLARALLERTELDLVLIGHGDEAAEARALAAELGSDRVRDLVGQTTLEQVPDLLRGARAFVGVDSGMAHLSAALGIPSVVLFSGFADIRVWAPAGPRTVVLHSAAACAPCRLPSHAQCPHAFACMTVIGPQNVLAALALVACDESLAALGGGAASTLAAQVWETRA